MTLPHSKLISIPTKNTEEAQRVLSNLLVHLRAIRARVDAIHAASIRRRMQQLPQ